MKIKEMTHEINKSIPLSGYIHPLKAIQFI